MKEQIALVFQLHEQDLKGQKLQQALDAITPELKELETLVANHRSQLEGKSGKITELETQKRTRERDVETAEARLKDFQGKLSMIKTNKEYQAALKEMADTKKLNKTKEDQILEIMTQMEGLKTDQREAEEVLKSAAETLEKRQKELAGETERLQSMLREVETEKKSLASRLEPSLMAQYQRVRKGRAEAVSEVVAGTCKGCRMRIPPQLYIEIQKMKTIHSCPSCQRILYLPEWVEKKPDPRNGALAGEQKV